jgi:hypothetical protein
MRLRDKIKAHHAAKNEIKASKLKPKPEVKVELKGKKKTKDTEE